MIYYSPKLISQIKDSLRGKPAYIVSGNSCNDDIRLAVALGLPIFTGSPYNNCLYSKISNCYKLFEECNLPLPPSSMFLYKKEEIIPNLTKLIIENFHIERWVLKIDNENSGRGIAYFDITSVPEIASLRKEAHTYEENELHLELQSMLLKWFPKRLKFAYTNLYKNYGEYVSEFSRNGGVIQASPSQLSKKLGSPGITFSIAPDGDLKI